MRNIARGMSLWAAMMEAEYSFLELTISAEVALDFQDIN